jgi:hypothetical protein
MWCPYITPKNNYRKFILVTTIFGGVSVLMPFSDMLLICDVYIIVINIYRTYLHVKVMKVFSDKNIEWNVKKIRCGEHSFNFQHWNNIIVVLVL